MLPAASAAPRPPPSVSVPVMLIRLPPVEPTQPALTPAYQPHQVQVGAGAGGGALIAISAAKAGPLNASAANTMVSLRMPAPPRKSCFTATHNLDLAVVNSCDFAATAHRISARRK